MNYDEINYGEKIETFKLMIENQNDDIALNYLQRTNWDEEKAVNLFNQENKTIPQSFNYKINNDRNLNNSYSPSFKKQSFDFSKYEQCPIIYPEKEGLLKGVINFFKKNYSNEYGIPNFKYLNGYASSYELFINLLKNRLGIIFAYDDNSLITMKGIVNAIIQDPSCRSLFNNKTVYPLYNLSFVGKEILSNIFCNKLPIMLVCKYIDEGSFSIIKKTKPGYLSIESLKETIKSAENLIESSIDNSSNNNISINQIKTNNNDIKKNEDNFLNLNSESLYNDFYYDQYTDYLSNGNIIAQQKRELEELERKEREKNEREKKKLEDKKKEEIRIENEKRKKEEELKLLEEKSIMLKNSLPKEPEDSNPDKCVIIFRYPDGCKNIERKFLKTNKIQILYNFIESLGREIYSEDNITKFTLIQTFPFKKYENKEKTLEEEGLFPNAMLQIKEIS